MEQNIEIINIKNHFEFVDLCEKNIEKYQHLENINNIIKITTELLNNQNELCYKTVKLLYNKLNKTNEIYEKIKKNLIK